MPLPKIRRFLWVSLEPMHMTQAFEDRGAPGDRKTVDRVSDSVRQALSSADLSSDIHDIVESARMALVEAKAVSLFGLETPHPDFGAVHWIVGRTEPPDGDAGDFLVFAIPEHKPEHGADAEDGWPLFAAGSDDLVEAFRQLPEGFCAGVSGEAASA